MEPVTFQGGAFSEYYCTKLLWTDPQLASKIDLEEARKLYKRASSVIRQAQRRLDGKVMPRSTCSDLLQPLAEVLGWRLGEAGKVVTELEQEEEAGVPLLAEGRDGPLARAVCISPGAHLDAAPAGLHRRFAPTLSLARVLSEENLDYGLLLNAYELRLVCNVGTLPSFIAFQLADIGEGTEPGWNAWRLLFTLLRQPALAEEPGLLDQVRKIGAEHQQSVSTLLGRQVQQAVVRFMQGVLDHPENRDRLPEQISDAYLHTLYEQTLRLLYRLLFCLYAEDLNLLPMDMLTYRDGYSLKRMIRLAKGQAANSLVSADPNGRFFQESLQALFALLRSGCNLGPEGAIQAYGGGLFDPGGTELIDGLAWGNAAVDDILELLNRVPAPKGQTGWVQLSYRELNVEQLGSIYEGLLEQTPAYAQTRVWQAELDSRIIVIDDANRQRIREVRGEKAAADALALEDEEEDGEDAGVAEGSDTEEEDQAAVDDEEQEQRPRKQSAKKPLRVLAEIRAGTVYLKGGLGRKQTGSYYTNRAFVNFLVREALEPLAEGRCPKEILALKVVDPAMGSAHFLVGACRRLAEHLLAAYRREVARIQAEDKKGELLEDDLLVLADVPPELAHVWSSRDQERELAVCRLLVAGNCIYGVDKNPLAVDLAKVSLWLVTAASRMPLSFLDHRLRCGDSLLGIPAEEVVRPWVPETNGTRGRKAKAAGRKPTNPVELLISPKHGQDTFDYFAPSRRALCQSFTRAFACLRQLLTSIEADPANFLEHRAQHAALRGTLEPWWQVHQLRVGMAFEPTAPDPEILNHWLEDLLNVGRVSDEHREPGERFRQSGEDQGAFCWELAFPEVFFQPDGNRRDDAGFSCVLGNPPWDKIKPERDGFYLAYDPLIRQFQGTQKNRRIEELHRENPLIAEAWRRYEFETGRQADVLLAGGIYFHQTAVIEEEVEGDDGEPTIKRKTTGGDPDCFKLFLERAWQLAATNRGVGMVMSSGLHGAQGCTGLRRLLFGRSKLRALVKFDNEMRVFPGVHNQFKFDLVVFEKGGPTQELGAAFFSRETENALQQFRTHRNHLRLPADDVCRLSPQTLTLFEFRGQRDVDLVEKAYRLHPPFGAGLMAKLGLKFRREFDMGNNVYLFRTRDWLREHGCRQEPGEQWRAADAEWYRARGYIERPIAQWYALFDGGRAVAHKIPWPLKSSKHLKESDLDDFNVRLVLPGGARLYAKPPDDGGEASVFVRLDEARETDLPAYIPAAKKLRSYTIAPAIRAGDAFLPFVEAKWIYHLDHHAYAYVSGGGSWVVTRPASESETDQLPHYFMGRLDAETRTPRQRAMVKIGIRDVSSSTNERTVVAAPIPASFPCNDATPTFNSETASDADIMIVVAWLTCIVNDFLARMTGGRQKLFTIKPRPAPCEPLLARTDLAGLAARIACLPGAQNSADRPAPRPASCQLDRVRAVLDAVMAECLEVTPPEYAYMLSTFPLLDRDQPPLPHDYRIRATNKGVERRPISFITRDLAMLTYFDYLAGRLEIKPDAERVARICPDGVSEPPTDIVEFFAEAGVDIGGKTEHAVAATGPFRDLRERVAKARELGAVAYVPTIDRRRATFVERAAAAGGLSPEEGVLTPEMAAHVLRAKAERDAKWQRAMQLWEQTPFGGELKFGDQAAAGP